MGNGLYPNPDFVLRGAQRAAEEERIRGEWPHKTLLPMKRNMTNGEEGFDGRKRQCGMQLGTIRRSELSAPVVRSSFGDFSEPLAYPSIDAMLDDGWRGD